MLARLWRREVEADPYKLPPRALPELPPKHSTQAPSLESLGTPTPDSLEKPPRRSPMTAPIARVWLLDREVPPPSEPTPRDHAGRLLRWLSDYGYAGKMVLAMDVKKIYPVMCEELGWDRYPWQPVAVELRKLTGEEMGKAP